MAEVIDVEFTVEGPPPLPRGRRARDRAIAREGTHNPALGEVQSLIDLVDDDLREAALAAETVERWLTVAMDLLDFPDVSADDLERLAGDTTVLERIDYLRETLAGLRRRLSVVASRLPR